MILEIRKGWRCSFSLSKTRSIATCDGDKETKGQQEGVVASVSGTNLKDDCDDMANQENFDDES